MAFSYGFYNSLNGDRRYKGEDFDELVGSLLTEGVFENVGDKLFASPGSGMEITVGSGKAWFNNTWSTNDSAMVLEVPQSDITRPRYDTVVLDVNSDLSVRQNKIMIVSGEPAVNPVKPTLINTEKHHQHPLAHIYVAAATTEIGDADIEILVGRTECPFVTGVLQKTDITDLYNQWNADFQTWFGNLKSQLTDNIVTNLQSQINSLTETVEGIETSLESVEDKVESVGKVELSGIGYVNARLAPPYYGEETLRIGVLGRIVYWSDVDLDLYVAIRTEDAIIYIANVEYKQSSTTYYHFKVMKRMLNNGTEYEIYRSPDYGSSSGGYLNGGRLAYPRHHTACSESNYVLVIGVQNNSTYEFGYLDTRVTSLQNSLIDSSVIALSEKFIVSKNNNTTLAITNRTTGQTIAMSILNESWKGVGLIHDDKYYYLSSVNSERRLYVNEVDLTNNTYSPHKWTYDFSNVVGIITEIYTSLVMYNDTELYIYAALYYYGYNTNTYYEPSKLLKIDIAMEPGLTYCSNYYSANSSAFSSSGDDIRYYGTLNNEIYFEYSKGLAKVNKQDLLIIMLESINPPSNNRVYSNKREHVYAYTDYGEYMISYGVVFHNSECSLYGVYDISGLNAYNNLIYPMYRVYTEKQNNMFASQVPPFYDLITDNKYIAINLNKTDVMLYITGGLHGNLVV